MNAITEFESDKCLLSFIAVLFITAQYLPLIPSGSFFTNFGAIIFWTNVGLIYSEVLKYE